MNETDGREGEMMRQPAAYDDFCKCGHRDVVHLETGDNVFPCSIDTCSCDDYDEQE